MEEDIYLCVSTASVPKQDPNSSPWHTWQIHCESQNSIQCKVKPFAVTLASSLICGRNEINYERAFTMLKVNVPKYLGMWSCYLCTGLGVPMCVTMCTYLLVYPLIGVSVIVYMSIFPCEAVSMSDYSSLCIQ